jgi:peptidoglycan/LPS O-acetylase OafA/YrhL
VSFAPIAKDFWKRRLKRLYPALAAYVVAMIPLTWLLQDYSDQPHSDLGSFMTAAPFALAYTMNYWAPTNPMSLGHLWSVSCEMQFYLVAPFLFAAGGKNATRRIFAWGTILAVMVTAGLWGPILDSEGKYKYHFEQAVWPMMLGFCCEYRKAWFQRFPTGWPTMIVRGTLILFGASLVLMLFGGQMKKLVIAMGAFVCVPCFIAYANGRDIPGVVGRALAWIGERTYSIYLWQQPFTICNFLPTMFHPLGALISVFVGGLWFHWFERPFLSVARKHHVK